MKNLYTPPKTLPAAKNLRIVQGDINLGVQGEGFSYMFSSGANNLTGMKFNGIEFISALPTLNFWRAPIDNDYGNGNHLAAAQWKLASLYSRCVKIEYRVGSGEFVAVEKYFGEKVTGEFAAESFAARYTYRLCTSPESFCVVTYEVEKTGALKVSLDYEKVDALPDIPDFSILFTIPKSFSRVKFYGLEPRENYGREGAHLGIFETTTAAEVEPYLRPQECGNHCGGRWLEVVDPRDRGIKIFGDNPFEASALPYSPHELENATHLEELSTLHHTFVKISAGQYGIGGDDSWGSPVLEEYKLKNADRHFEFRIKVV